MASKIKCGYMPLAESSYGKVFVSGIKIPQSTKVDYGILCGQYPLVTPRRLELLLRPRKGGVLTA